MAWPSVAPRLAAALQQLVDIDDAGAALALVFEGGRHGEGLAAIILANACHVRLREAAERYGVEAGEMTVCKVVEDDAKVELRVAGDWIAPWLERHPASG